jgi:hypothetical protein
VCSKPFDGMVHYGQYTGQYGSMGSVLIEKSYLYYIVYPQMSMVWMSRHLTFALSMLTILSTASIVISSRSVQHSLCHPSGLVPHISGRCSHRSGAPDRSRHLPTHCYGLLAWYVDFASSFRCHHHSSGSWVVSNHVYHYRQPSGGPDRP